RGGATGLCALRAAGRQSQRAARGRWRRRPRRARPRRAVRDPGDGMTLFVLFLCNVVLVAAFVVIGQRPGLLGFARGGRWYLTWLSVGVITLMDELTSVYYAPAEAHRFIGAQAIFFIAFTSLLMRLLSSRMVEIAQILELNDIRGGGVYS